MKVAAMRFSALGDLAAALPFLRALRERPTVVTSPLGRELLADECDAFIVLPDKRLSSVWRLILDLRRARCDVLIDLQGNDRSRLIRALSGARRVCSNRGLPRGVPNLENYRRICEPSGLLGDLDTRFEPRPRRYIVLNAGSSAAWRSKRLPDAKWREIGTALRTRFGLPFTLTGGADEREYVAHVATLLSGPCENLAGCTTLPQLKRVLAAAWLVVSTDSAAMQLAAALKTPTIGLFGATNWVRSAPFGPWSTVVFDRAAYPDGRPPVPNRRDIGAYYDGLDIGEGLARLEAFLR